MRSYVNVKEIHEQMVKYTSKMIWISCDPGERGSQVYIIIVDQKPLKVNFNQQ